VTSSEVRPDDAVARARRVVGLYGDPDVTWSIVLAVTFAAARRTEDVQARAEALVARYPHLGSVPPVQVFGPAEEADLLAAMADTEYRDHLPLLRVGIAEDGRTLLVAAHHGATDGLGLLGAAAALADADLASSARGITREAQPTGFLRRTVVRLAEVLVHPPVRFAAETSAPASGDLLLSRPVTAPRPSSAALVAAAATSLRRWNGSRRAGGRRLVVSMGLSRRPGTPVAPPDRDTAYVRLPADGVAGTAQAADVMRATDPEPAFPETDGGGVGPLAARLLANRLGATVLVSNLGVVADPDVLELRFWPVPTGPSGCALGLASTPTSTVLTVRLRRGWFSAAAGDRLADLVAEEFGTLAR